MEAGGVLEIERETHRKHGESLAVDFVETPRAGALRDVARYVSDLPGHLLVVTGAPGSGKSALLATATRRAIEDRPGAAIIQRFFGISPRSSDPRTLLADLCDEIGAAYGQSAALPQEFRLLAQELDRLLHFATPGQPLLLFLDALDQMSEAESAHHLAWLPARLPPHVGIVVSTLPGECQRALERKRPAVSTVVLGDLSAGDNGEAAEIFDSMMTRPGRQLQPGQRAVVLNMAAHCPRPLFLRLASAEAIRWKSYTAVGTLPDSVDGLIRRYLETLALEVNHGTTLVARSLGYLAAAKRGLTEDELLDVLSEDDEVLADFARRSRYGHALPDRRLPVVVWSRLSFDLQPYLAERRADGTNLIGFYHGQLRPIVHELFVASREELLHKRLAKYFGDQPPLTPSGSERVNVRRVSELPFHQIHCHDWTPLEETLGNIDFLHLKAVAGLVFDTIDDFELVEARMKTSDASPELMSLLNEVARVYNQEFRTFQGRPIAGQQIFQQPVRAQRHAGSCGSQSSSLQHGRATGARRLAPSGERCLRNLDVPRSRSHAGCA